jgi:putative ABC transport system permease protein
MVVGVATVMVMVAFGKGAERRVLERVRALGSDAVIVTTPPSARVAGRQRQVATTTALRPADADAIRDGSAHALRAAASVQRSLAARWSDRSTLLAVVGTTADGLIIRRITARTGRVFDDDEDRGHRRVALIGETAVRNLFGTTDPVGLEIRIGSVPFEIIGVMTPRGTDIGGTDLDNEIVIPLGTAMRRVLNIPYVHTIYAQAVSGNQLDALEADVRAILAERHPARAGTGAAEPFLVQNQAVLLRTERGASRAINRLIVAVASLSVVVGAVGIATVMFLSVRERSREIGLRRAVGARRRDIQIQFLVEAALTASVGAALGVAIAFAVATAGAYIGRWNVAFSWTAAAIAMLVAALSGMSAGAIPASRAVGVEPMAALRARG